VTLIDVSKKLNVFIKSHISLGCLIVTVYFSCGSSWNHSQYTALMCSSRGH